MELATKSKCAVEILGASLDTHPLELVSEKIVAAGAISTLEAVERIGRRVTVAGVRQTSHRSRTAKGDAMLFLTVEDLHGTLDVILFPDVYRTVKSFANSNIPCFLQGLWKRILDAQKLF